MNVTSLTSRTAASWMSCWFENLEKGPKLRKSKKGQVVLEVEAKKSDRIGSGKCKTCSNPGLPGWPILSSRVLKHTTHLFFDILNNYKKDSVATECESSENWLPLCCNVTSPASTKPVGIFQKPNFAAGPDFSRTSRILPCPVLQGLLLKLVIFATSCRTSHCIEISKIWSIAVQVASEFVTNAPTPTVWLAFAGSVFGESGNLGKDRSCVWDTLACFTVTIPDCRSVQCVVSQVLHLWGSNSLSLRRAGGLYKLRFFIVFHGLQFPFSFSTMFGISLWIGLCAGQTPTARHVCLVFVFTSASLHVLSFLSLVFPGASGDCNSSNSGREVIASRTASRQPLGHHDVIFFCLNVVTNQMKRKKNLQKHAKICIEIA